MPLDDIAGDIIGTIFRFLGRIFVEIVVELLIKGPGYLICRLFWKDVDPDGFRVLVAGLVFWFTVIAIGYGTYRYFAAAGA